MAISGSSQKPMAVFIGSSIALVLATAIGVLLGGTFSSLIPSYIIEFIAAIGFLIIGISLWIAAPGEET
ncbi:hypothetical protein EV06_1177 [Prochlorococcus sp. MIT 0602]|nr:hypothetical protein EV06_1177 [Prochlorococcus sp. MIT 0602]KGG17585.1 hypothetical protein EV07_1025 [Prochlorococcus sp. MIT 0603]